MSMVRQPAVAGTFYSAEGDALKRWVERLAPTVQARRAVRAVVVPHAGFMYSGGVAGLTFASALLPGVVIVVAVNHSGLGAPLPPPAFSGVPLGTLNVDAELVGDLLARAPFVIDDRAPTPASTRSGSAPVPGPQGDFRSCPSRWAATSPPACASSAWPSQALSAVSITGVAGASPTLPTTSPMRCPARRSLCHREDPRRRWPRPAEHGRRAGIRCTASRRPPRVLIAARELGARQGIEIAYATSADAGGDPGRWWAMSGATSHDARRGWCWSRALAWAARAGGAVAPMGPGDNVQRLGAAPPGTSPRASSRSSPTSNYRDGDTIVADGKVVVRYGPTRLEADHVELDVPSKDAKAVGHVTLAQGECGLPARGRSSTWRLASHAARRLGLRPARQIFRGESVAKIGPQRYLFRKASVSACDEPTPTWDFRASRATLAVNDYVRMVNTVLRVKRVPLVYIPWIQYPTGTDRSTGFLFPSFGSNNRRGAAIPNSFFWAIARSYDLTLTHSTYGSEGNSFGTELNYAPAEAVAGSFSSTNWRDKATGKTSSSYRARHDEKIGRNYVIYGTLDYQTSSTFDQQYSNNFARAADRRRNSILSLARRSGLLTWDLNASQARDLSSSDLERSTERLPNLNVRLRSLRLKILQPSLTGSYVNAGSRRIARDRARALHRVDHGRRSRAAQPVALAALNPWSRRAERLQRQRPRRTLPHRRVTSAVTPSSGERTGQSWKIYNRPGASSA